MDDRYKNITFCNYPEHGLVGIWVRIMWRKRKFQRLFRRNQLNKALVWRDSINEEIGKPNTERRITSQIYDQGITEVVKQSDRKGKRSTRHFSITYSKDGIPHRTSVSISKHGRQKALDIARTIREKAIADYLN